MSVYKSTVSSKGQVVLPAELRKRLRIEPGSEVLFEIEGNGAHLTTNWLEQVLALRGRYAHVRPPLTEQLRREREKERNREDRRR